MIENNIIDFRINKKYKLKIRVFVVIVLILAFIVSSSHIKAVIMPVSSAQDKTIHLATYRYAEQSRIENLQPLAEIIRKETGFKVSITSYPNIAEFLLGIKKGNVDIALISTMGYLLLKQDGNNAQKMEEVLALTVPNTSAEQYQTAFIAPYYSSITSLKSIASQEQLKLGLVTPSSTSGNLIPRMVLSNMLKVNLDSIFKKIEYFGTHLKTLEAVAEGKVDLAAVGSSTFLSAKNMVEGEKIKLIYMSGRIPLGPVLFNKSLDNKSKKQLLKIFETLHLVDIPAFNAIKNGWSEAKNAEHFIRIDAFYHQSILADFGNTAVGMPQKN